MNAEPPGFPVRDQLPTEFAAVLRRITRAIPGGIGAVFCDEEGEAVDFFGPLDPFELKVAGAQLAWLHADLGPRLGRVLGAARLVHMRGDKWSYLYAAVSDSYFVVAVLRPFASWWEAREDVESAVDQLRLAVE